MCVRMYKIKHTMTYYGNKITSLSSSLPQNTDNLKSEIVTTENI